jgi:hypothetical protein
VGVTTPYNNPPSTNPFFFLFPVTVSFVGVRSGRSALEVGAGATLVFASGYSNGDGTSYGGSFLPVGVAMVGYRNQPVHRSGFMFRAGLEAVAARHPFYGPQGTTPEKIGVWPWPYLSLGTSF